MTRPEDLLYAVASARQGMGNLPYDDPITIFDLTISICYQRALLPRPNVGIRKHFFLEEKSFSYGLADFLTGVYPERARTQATTPRIG